MPIKTLFTAHADATGGRNGHAQADDGLVSVDLSVPKAMGGPGTPDTTTPEHLFAAGYAACLGGATGVSQEDAEKAVAAGHAFCPYSKAIKGNVDVNIKATAA